ncbi:MAG: methyl-accepting chemotaxis protein [Candidatus Omnitrophica bacterium]|nr:methyl-accepting chemotaxis protein [Candidatus Omnitrophota bacterium]
MTNNRRNLVRYFIKKEFQLKMIYQFWALLIVSAILAGAALVFIAASVPVKQFLLSRFSIDYGSSQMPYGFLSVGFISIILISCTAFVIIIYYAYRVAGPLFNIEKNVKQIGESGDLTKKIKLRNEDESQIKDLAESLNNMLENMESMVYRIKVRSDQLESELERLSACRDGEEIKSSLEEIQSSKKDLDRAIEAFKLNSPNK